MLRRKGRKSVNKRIGDFRGRFTDVKTIHERPTKAETREELGHWEADSVLSVRHSTVALATLYKTVIRPKKCLKRRLITCIKHVSAIEGLPKRCKVDYL
ncbi:hypothetical protein [Enterococcus haemoperoxidus]|nr:hypothetical protein [Enterococcus haemoperoxidus]OJG50756.1 hypothetical protein RV06_GL001675 [Enterococcus haemoperoxidus]